MEIPEKQNAKTTPFEPLVDSRTAAATLGLHYKTLERLARKGEAPGTKMGRSWVFRLSVLSDWCDRKMRSNSEDDPAYKPKKEDKHD